MTDLRVIGIDPGPTPGLVRLHIVNGHLVDGWTHVVQSSGNCLPEILGSFLSGSTAEWPVTVVQLERFVVGRKSMRSAAAGATTRDMVGLLTQVCHDAPGDVRVVQRSAAAVKPWATDERLARAGLLEATKGMTHARDAGRHALFSAVHDGDLPDPLSKEFKR